MVSDFAEKVDMLLIEATVGLQEGADDGQMGSRQRLVDAFHGGNSSVKAIAPSILYSVDQKS